MAFDKSFLKILILFFLYCGIATGCSSLSTLNSGNGSGDSQEETRNTPPPNPEGPEGPAGASIVVAGGGGCPSGQCTQDGHGTTDDSYLYVRVIPHNKEPGDPIEFSEPYPTVTVRFGWGDTRPWEIREKDTVKDSFGSLLRFSANNIARLCNPDVRVIQDGDSGVSNSFPAPPSERSLLLTASYENSGISFHSRPAIYTCPEDTTQHLVKPPTILLKLIPDEEQSQTQTLQGIDWEDLIDKIVIKKGTKSDL